MAAAKARAVRFDHYGGREVLYVADIDRPVPGAGEVLVEVRAAGINPGEAGIRTGALHEQFPTTFPSGEGSDLAGVVVEVGDGVSDFAVGDEVLTFGNFDELVDQARRLLDDSGLGAKLGDAAAARAHHSHTYQRRLTVVLEKLC